VAYQDVKPGMAFVLPPWGTIEEKLAKLHREYGLLAQEVRECHKRIQQFSDLLTNGVITTKTIVMPHPTFTTDYYVGVQFAYNAGAYWITSKTTAQFVVNFATAAGFNEKSVRYLVVE
jgi:hypothetical protein